MKRLYIFKTGCTVDRLKRQFGDFEDWTIDALGPTAMEKAVVDTVHASSLPLLEQCAGVAITGAHAMVTEKLPWSVKLEAWLRDAMELRVPILGICYGHQLLAQALGGTVEYHPKGIEIGTVDIDLLPSAVEDPLFSELPPSFKAHVTHSQTVNQLPHGAIRLAGNAHETNHAFRLGERAWGVQFHPEYNAEIMREYIEALADELEPGAVPVLVGNVEETPVAAQVIRRFAEYVSA